MLKKYGFMMARLVFALWYFLRRRHRFHNEQRFQGCRPLEPVAVPNY
jgi:hypothetical protein